MTTKRRKMKTCLTLRPDNVDFVYDYVLPSHPDDYRGRFTKGLADVIEGWLNHFGNQIPEPPLNDDRHDLERVDLTLEPSVMRNLDWFVAEWQEMDRSRNHTRSEAVDYFIDLTRTRLETLQRQQKEAAPE